MPSAPQSFWEHLDALRSSIVKSAIVVVVCSIATFCFKTELFDVLLAPCSDDFVTYRLLEQMAAYVTSGSATPLQPLDVQLINTGLAQQFMLHLKAAFSVGFLMALPYIIYLLFHFVSPALYTHERRLGIRLVVSGYFMFMLGLLLTYFLIFPLTFRFLGSYQVSDVVANTVTLSSYLETLLMLGLSMGVVFEIPVICRLLAGVGLLRSGMMRKYRRHVIVSLLVLAAIITPTADAFTLFLVAIPMWLLFEVSILVVSSNEVKSQTDA